MDKEQKKGISISLRTWKKINKMRRKKDIGIGRETFESVIIRLISENKE